MGCLMVGMSRPWGRIPKTVGKHSLLLPEKRGILELALSFCHSRDNAVLSPAGAGCPAQDLLLGSWEAPPPSSVPLLPMLTRAIWAWPDMPDPGTGRSDLSLQAALWQCYRRNCASGAR